MSLQDQSDDEDAQDTSDQESDMDDDEMDFDLNSSDDSEEEVPDDNFSAHEEDYNAKETSINLMFPKRLSCVDHGLELVTSKVIDNYPPTKTAIKIVRKQIRRIRQSPKEKAALKSKSGRVPILPSITRWSGTVLMLKVYLPMANEMNKVKFK